MLNSQHLVIVCLFSLLPCVFSISCHVCTGCEFPSNKSTLDTCNGVLPLDNVTQCKFQPYCFYAAGEMGLSGTMVFIDRGCAHSDHCQMLEAMPNMDLDNCYVCSVDYCNSQLRGHSVEPLLLASLLLISQLFIGK